MDLRTFLHGRWLNRLVFAKISIRRYLWRVFTYLEKLSSSQLLWVPYFTNPLPLDQLHRADFDQLVHELAFSTNNDSANITHYRWKIWISLKLKQILIIPNGVGNTYLSNNNNGTARQRKTRPNFMRFSSSSVKGKYASNISDRRSAI